MVYCLTSLLFFYTLLLGYYINLRLSIIICLSSADIYPSFRISLGTSFSFSLLTVSELFCYEFFVTFAIILAIFLSINSPVASAVFFSYSFWSSFKRICSRLFSIIKKFLAVFTTQAFTYIFTNSFTHTFSKRQKIPRLLQIFNLSVELYCTLFFFFNFTL